MKDGILNGVPFFLFKIKRNQSFTENLNFGELSFVSLKVLVNRKFRLPN